MPDSDGVIRRYHLWETRDGWDIISMPQRLASSFNWPQQSHENQLLQWMGKPLTHSMVSFSDLYLDSQKKQKTRPQDEFKGKIVIIGATAASLFDSKGSPLSYVHPGVDILATAIDNTKNDHFLQEIPAWLQILITFFLLTVMVWLSLHFSHEQLEFAFLAAPSILLLIAYLSMNVGSTFIDLSTPASITLIYFTIAKFYSFVVRQYWSGQAPYNVTISTGTQYHIGALASPELRGLHFRIEGHTDNVGTAQYNQKLSLQRAEEVKRILIANRINPDQLVTEGKGFSEPANHQDLTAAENRRVRIVNIAQ